MYFVHRGTVDYAGYLRARDVDDLLAFPSMNVDARAWTPAALQSLPPGGETTAAGVHFRRLVDADIVRIVR